MERLANLLREGIAIAFRFFQQSVLSLRYNWGLGLLSLALAVSLWVFVTDQENPTRTEAVPGAIPVEAVNVPPEQAVVSIAPGSVGVRVSASESVFERLTAEDFRATVDLSGVTVREVTVDVRVESKESRAEIEDWTPRRVVVTLENVTSRSVPVRAELVGTLPPGFRAGEVTVQPEEAVVSGPQSLVERVAAVEADVNLTGVRTDLEQRLPLQPRDERGGELRGVSVEPRSAAVQVRVVQVEFTGTFIVRPDVRGTPAEGFNVTAVLVDPPVVAITAPAETLQGIDVVTGVPTEEISIEGARAPVTRTVVLRLPEGARADQRQVTVTVVIAAAQGQFTFSVAPRISGVAPDLAVALSRSAVLVTLAGTVPELSAVSPADIVVTLDLSGRGAGVHSVPVQVQPPPRTTVVSVVPPALEVTLRPP